jgi:single-strand DNA-binding protein
MNKVFLIGNVGKTPELKYLPNGTAKLEFSIATSESWKDKVSGQWQEKSTWHSIFLFGKQAEQLNTILSKGTEVFIEGKISVRSWEKEGKTVYKNEIMADKVKAMARHSQAKEDPDLSQSIKNIGNQLGLNGEAVFVPEFTTDDLPF